MDAIESGSPRLILSRFTHLLVTLSKRAVSDRSSPATKERHGGCADWIIIVTHGLREYLDDHYPVLNLTRSVGIDELYDRTLEIHSECVYVADEVYVNTCESHIEKFQ